MTPIANSLSWIRCCQTPLGRGFETCVDVRAELGDALCNLVVLPTRGSGGVLCPFNGAFRQPVANDRPTRYIITRGRPIDEYRGKNIVSPSIWLLVGTMVHTRTGAGFCKKKLKKNKKFYRKKFKKI